jgi:ATP-dependent RNA helicase DeaD
VLAALGRANYLQPTPIQAAFVPHALTGRDVIGQAQTGTGKTAAFLLPFLHTWASDALPATAGPQGLILAPTRELVLQVAEEAKRLAPSPDFRTVTVIGGQGIGGQQQRLKAGCNLVVGSPGRVIDHLSRGTLSLAGLKYIVLDEADRMLDIGFRPDIERILRRCPSERQTLLLSATLPDEVLRLAHRYLQSPLHVNVSPPRLTVEKIRQSYITVDEYRKFDLLLRVLEREQPRQGIIFTQTKIGSFELYRQLRDHFPRVAAMHGDLPQGQRERIMTAFRQRKIALLIATDVVGRGIDVTGISHVFNYDMPDDPENYVHRVGRTGRMGKDGMAISFVTPEQGRLLTNVENVINRVLEVDHIDGFQAYESRAKPEPALAGAEAPKSQPVFGKPSRRYKRGI